MVPDPDNQVPGPDDIHPFDLKVPLADVLLHHGCGLAEDICRAAARRT